MTIHWKAVELYFTVVLFVLQFNRVCIFRKFLSVLDLALSEVKRLSSDKIRIFLHRGPKQRRAFRLCFFSFLTLSVDTQSISIFICS